MPLEPENERLLVAAQGFLELGLPLDANEEIENIDPDVRHVPEVLAVRVQVYRALEKWELMRTVAKKLREYDRENSHWPILWAFATRRAESIRSTREILTTAWKIHDKEPMILFNLAGMTMKR